MNENNKTALMCSFVRAYHHKDNNLKVYDDKYSDLVLSIDEYNDIKNNLIKGIKFFNSSFNGSDEEALKWIVNNQLGPSVLGRSAFNKKVLDNAIKIGCRQYIIYASGYDTSGLNYNINVFEIDQSYIIKDKINRLTKINNSINYIEADLNIDNYIKKLIDNGYDKNIKSHNSLLGLSYYLEKEEFNSLLSNISNNISIGSSIIFDYQTKEESKETNKNEILAKGAGEYMKSKYSYKEIEKILEENNLYIYEYLNDKDITSEYFYDYNTLNPDNKIIAPEGVAYVLAVKK